MHYAIYPNGLIYMVCRERAWFPRSTWPFIKTKAEVLAMPSDKLLQIYNMNAEIKVKDFASDEEARERIEALLINDYDPKDIPMAKRTPNTNAADASTDKNAATDASTAGVATTEKATSSRTPKSAVIRVLATANPKRSGSAAHQRFALYKDGMTVSQFIEAGGTMADINFDQGKKFIELEGVEAAAGEAATAATSEAAAAE